MRMVWVNRVLRELPIMIATVITAVFGANDTLDVVGTSHGWDKWGFLLSFLVFAGLGIWRVLRLETRLDEYAQKVRVTARLGDSRFNFPDPGKDKVSISVGLIWEVWVSQEDVSAERVAVNLIFVYKKRWWQFWKKARVPLKGIPLQGKDDTRYRRQYSANQIQPNIDEGTFDYTGDRRRGQGNFELEFVLQTGIPVRKFRIPIPVNFDLQELLSRGTNPPL